MLIDQDSTSYAPGFVFYDDNIRLLKASLRQILARTADLASFSLLSLGIGHRHVVAGLLQATGERLRDYVIVEGSPRIIEMFVGETSPPPHVRLIQAYFEDFDTDERFDVIEMGFVLEHVVDPALVLRRFARFLAPGGRMFIAVPNAHSLHRLIGHEAGLLADMHTLGEGDIALGHRRYFDPGSIKALVEACGLRVVGTAGLMLKPVTTAQMASLALSPQVLEAMDRVGEAWPNLCNGIFLEARP